MNDARRGPRDPDRSPAGTPPSADSGPQPTFEAALAELEGIVARLERGELTLDESVAAFERGTDLLRFLSVKLEEAEKRVKLLMEEQGGDLVERVLEDEASE